MPQSIHVPGLEESCERAKESHFLQDVQTSGKRMEPPQSWAGRENHNKNDILLNLTLFLLRYNDVTIS